MAPRRGGGPPFLQGASGRGLGPVFGGLNKALRSALVPVVPRLWWFRLFVFSFAFGVSFCHLAVAAVSRLFLFDTATASEKNVAKSTKLPSCTYRVWKEYRLYQMGKSAGPLVA